MQFLYYIFLVFIFFQEGFSETLKCENFDIKAIYVGASDKIASKIPFAKKNSINAFVIDVKNDLGEITCNFGTYKSNRNIKDMNSLLSKLKKEGIYTIARIVVFKDKLKIEENPNLAIKNKEGSIYIDKEKKRWLNPYLQETQNYIIDIAKSAAKAGFDEIQFDYIRFPPFQSLYNTNIENYLKEKSKIQLINEFLKKAVNELHKLNVKVSVDVFGCVIPNCMGELTQKSAENLGQNYEDIAKIADYICPMIYPSHWPIDSFNVKYPDLEPFTIIKKSMQLSKKALGLIHSQKVRPYLQAFTATWLKKGHWQIYKQKQVQMQIDALKYSHISQFCLWNPAGNYCF